MDKLEDLREVHKINLLAKQLTVAQFIADSLEESEEKKRIIKYLNSGIVTCQQCAEELQEQELEEME